MELHGMHNWWVFLVRLHLASRNSERLPVTKVSCDLLGLFHLVTWLIVVRHVGGPVLLSTGVLSVLLVNTQGLTILLNVVHVDLSPVEE